MFSTAEEPNMPVIPVPAVREGDWFAIPLRDGGYGLGVVARKGKGGVLLGYFFGPRRDAVPTLDDAKHLSPSETVLIEIFGDLSLRDRTWPLLGQLTSWRREIWTIPRFSRTEPLSGRAWIVVYGDDPRTRLREEPCSLEVASKLRPDGLSGSGAVEIQLTELLRAPEDKG
jgi:hypothetical protein